MHDQPQRSGVEADILPPTGGADHLLAAQGVDRWGIGLQGGKSRHLDALDHLSGAPLIEKAGQGLDFR